MFWKICFVNESLAIENFTKYNITHIRRDQRIKIIQYKNLWEYNFFHNSSLFCLYKKHIKNMKNICKLDGWEGYLNQDFVLNANLNNYKIKSTLECAISQLNNLIEIIIVDDQNFYETCRTFIS